MGNLYIVSTPIGNLEDITLRALRVLKDVDFILAEDTRRTKTLLDFYKIKTPLISYFEHSRLKKTSLILRLLQEGKNLALVSEAGTPGILDPGPKLVSTIRQMLGEKVKIIPVPGPSALTSAISISGWQMNKFLFLGFLPVKKRRKKFLAEIVNSKYPVVFFESPYRIVKTLSQLSQLKNEMKIIICRELTKKFETVYLADRVSEMIEIIKAGNVNNLKGEFVVLIMN